MVSLRAAGTGRRARQQRGQTMIVAVLVLGIFLVGFVGFATDYTNFWFHKQAAQGAADAACTAGAMDLLLFAQGRGTANMGFTPSVGTSLSCSSTPGAAPCKYAKFNGYDAGGLQAGAPSNDITISFPATVSGLTAPTGVSVPYISVTLTDRVGAAFSKLLSDNSTVDVGASATCGLVTANAPVSITALHPGPVAGGSPALSVSGSGTVYVVGGPQRSIQVDTSSTDPVAAPSVSISATLDLTTAGPTGTGGDVASYGGPTAKPASLNVGSTGHWVDPAAPLPDPYAGIAAPTAPSAAPTPVGVAFGVNGCPDPSGCIEFSPGSYASGITVPYGGVSTAIFDPGLYYLQSGGLSVTGPGIVRPSTATGNGSGGVTFYLQGAAVLAGGATSLLLASDSSHILDCPVNTPFPPSMPCLARYVVAGATETYCLSTCDLVNTHQVTSVAMQCTGGPAVPTGVPATLNGNVLLGPCTDTYADPAGRYRGFVFFQDRSTAAAPLMGGGGAPFTTAGLSYFHQCNASGTGTGCLSPSSGGYGTALTLQGNSGQTNYRIGPIVADRLQLAPNSGTLKLFLDANATVPGLRAQLLR
jgi:Putative Flp pilus-assembly TadE/G-like